MVATSGRRLSLAVIGAGPRALGALEALGEAAAETGLRLHIEVFDAHTPPASGPNFDPAAAQVECLNLPVRAVDLPPVRSTDSAGSDPGAADFATWLAAHHPGQGPEDFPPRAHLGDYMHARWQHLVAVLRHGGHALQLHPTCARRLAPADAGWMVDTPQGCAGPFDEVVLAMGQPQTAPDPQMCRWGAHAVRHGLTLLPVYPTEALHRAVPDWRGRIVAIRGLGLSTFDALRALTLGCGGWMEGVDYHPSGREPQRIVPFSLDGRPPAPKPASAAVDALYSPTEADRTRFRSALAACCAPPGDTALGPLLSVLAEFADAVLKRAGGERGSGSPRNWLQAELDDPGQQESDPPLQFLEQTMAMAAGRQPPSTGYAIGQIWRRLQPDLRAAFLAHAPATDVAQVLVRFDEGLKRYSYGPPLSAAEELHALVRAGIVTLRATADPDIELPASGWRLDPGNGARIEATVMLDAVLPGPDLSRLSEPLLVDLMEAGILSRRGKGLGVDCAPDGQVRDTDGKSVRGLSVLGRMALGTTIAVDSIHDCFGPACRAWAERIARR